MADTYWKDWSMLEISQHAFLQILPVYFQSFLLRKLENTTKMMVFGSPLLCKAS